MSRALVEGGYCSPLLTMDCKSVPSVNPTNKGELGPSSGTRNDKRKDIEVEGVFSGCFSYNARTEPTSDSFAKSRIAVCNLTVANDAFADHVEEVWQRVKR